MFECKCTYVQTRKQFKEGNIIWNCETLNISRIPKHPNIVTFYGVCPDKLWLVMELAECSLNKVRSMLGHVHGVNTNKCESPYNSRQIDFWSLLSKQKLKMHVWWASLRTLVFAGNSAVLHKLDRSQSCDAPTPNLSPRMKRVRDFIANLARAGKSFTKI